MYYFHYINEITERESSLKAIHIMLIQLQNPVNPHGHYYHNSFEAYKALQHFFLFTF